MAVKNNSGWLSLGTLGEEHNGHQVLYVPS
jgi:hypothetical protein